MEDTAPPVARGGPDEGKSRAEGRERGREIGPGGAAESGGLDDVDRAQRQPDEGRGPQHPILLVRLPWKRPASLPPHQWSSVEDKHLESCIQAATDKKTGMIDWPRVVQTMGIPPEECVNRHTWIHLSKGPSIEKKLGGTLEQDSPLNNDITNGRLIGEAQSSLSDDAETQAQEISTGLKERLIHESAAISRSAFEEAILQLKDVGSSELTSLQPSTEDTLSQIQMGGGKQKT